MTLTGFDRFDGNSVALKLTKACRMERERDEGHFEGQTGPWCRLYP